MEDGDEQRRGFHNRNSRRVEEHLSVSVDNEHSSGDGAGGSQNLKIGRWEPRGGAGWVSTGLGDDTGPRPPGRPPPRELLAPRRLLRVFLWVAIAFLAVGARVGAEGAAARAGEAWVGGSGKKEVANGRTFDGRRAVNKNCKEYDVTSRAFLADVIFEGTARSRSRRASGRHVTFVIQKILKQKGSLLRPKTQIRLQLGGKGERRAARVNPLSECPLTGAPSSARAMANVRVGERYYVFADHFGPMNYTARGEPIVVNRRNLKSIRSVLSRNKEKPPRVLALQDLNLKTTQQLRLICQVRGRPVPRINWFKDGAPLIPSSRVNVTYYRRNSTIEIKSVELKDGGVYECRATSVTGKSAKTTAHVSVWKLYTASTTDPEKSFHTKKCSVDAYCLNGGQCYFIEHLGEHMCECEPGFKGARCEIKEVSAIGIKSYVCGFNVGYSSYYC